MNAVEQAKEALRVFAEYERVRKAMRGVPQSGPLLAVHSSVGSAEITVEDMDRAIAALAALDTVPSVEDFRQAHREFWEENSADILNVAGPNYVFEVIEQRAREIARGRK